MAIVLLSCHDKDVNPNEHITLEAFSDMRTPCYVIDEHRLRGLLSSMADADKGRMSADRRTRNYYNGNNPLLWISRNGIGRHADTLLYYMRQTEDAGLRPDLYLVEQLDRDIDCIRNLDVNDTEDINKVMARLEYGLTKAYLRYASGQYYGFVNPNVLLNRFSVKDSDSVRVTYHHIYDVRLRHSDDSFFRRAIRKVKNDSLPEFIKEIQPHSQIYHKLISLLKVTSDPVTRRKIICNIERCRWRQYDYPEDHDKYVLVNIPSFHLQAVSGDSILTMNVGCGTDENMTPLLTSRIMRMDINPQWIVPKSIAKGIVYRSGYLQREHMFIYEKKRGKVGYEEASYTKIMDGQQFIIQEGGTGNSLGRIIFRFPNSFSVYLHDTSSPWLLQRSNRAISHGCVRLEKPFELAKFLIHGKDNELAERIRYSMTADIGGNNEDKKHDIDRNKLIKTVKVVPEVPLYITYYTYFPDKSGKLVEYNDVYGLDKVISDNLKPYIK